MEERRDHPDQGHIEEFKGWKGLHSISNEEDDNGNNNSCNTAVVR